MAFNYKTEIERYKRYYQNIGSSAGQPYTQAYTAAIFSFLAVSLFGWYAIRPTIETILFLQREITDNKAVSQQMEVKISKLIDAQAALQQYQKDLPLLAQALPQNPSAINVAAALKKLGNNTGATISAINLASTPLVSGAASQSGETNSTALSSLPNQKIIDIPITLTASGTYPNLQNFLNGIINLRRIITINSIDLAPNAQADVSTSEIQLRIVLKLTAHYLE